MAGSSAVPGRRLRSRGVRRARRCLGGPGRRGRGRPRRCGPVFSSCRRRRRSKVTGDERVWTLQFLLQAADDPSLIVPAERVWEETGDALSAFSRRLERPQERLLADLGRAARLFPPLEAGLIGAPAQRLPPDHHRGVPVPARGGAAARRERLRGAGAELVDTARRPPPGDQRPPGLGAVVHRRPGSASSRRASLVKFDWKLAIGDDELEPRELKRLARLKMPLVKVRGQWVELDATRVEEAIKFWEKRRRGKGVSARRSAAGGAGADDRGARPAGRRRQRRGLAGRIAASDRRGRTGRRAVLPRPTASSASCASTRRAERPG